MASKREQDSVPQRANNSGSSIADLRITPDENAYPSNTAPTLHTKGMRRRKLFGDLVKVGTGAVAGFVSRNVLDVLANRPTPLTILSSEQIEGAQQIRSYPPEPYRWTYKEDNSTLSRDYSVTDRSTADLIKATTLAGTEAGIVIIQLDPNVLTQYPLSAGLTIRYASSSEAHEEYTLTFQQVRNLLSQQNFGEREENHRLTLILANPNTLSPEQQKASNVITLKESIDITREENLPGNPSISCILMAEKLSFDTVTGRYTSSQDSVIPQYAFAFNSSIRTRKPY